MLDEGIFSEEQLIELLGDCIDKYKDDAKRARLKRMHDEMKDAKTLEAVVESINLQLKPLSLMIARMKSKISGSWETYYGVVNLNEDDGFAKQGWLSKSEQEFFHKLIEEILSSDVRERIACFRSAQGEVVRDTAPHMAAASAFETTKSRVDAAIRADDASAAPQGSPTPAPTKSQVNWGRESRRAENTAAYGFRVLGTR